MIALPAGPRRRWVQLGALLVFALLFLGTRGLWDPDEGRYSNVAINMVDSGDWLTPRRNEDVGHWTKPPLTYWAVGASIATFGRNPWAARLPSAFAFVLCAVLVWRIARRLAPGTEDVAATMYATMLLPWIGSQLVTTDFILAACETFALAAYVEGRWGTRGRMGYALMWVGFAFAFLAKGPPALLPLLAVLATELAVPGRRRAFSLVGVSLFVVIAGAWFVAVVARTPQLATYLLGNEVVGRVASNDFGRHGEWYGWLVVYVPTLLLGSLPWTLPVLRAARGQLARLPQWRATAVRAAEPEQVLLLGWWLLPLIVFCLARSRLPLYLLPLFVPLAISAAARFVQQGRAIRWPWLGTWLVVLLAIRVAGAYVPSTQDARAWGDALRNRSSAPIARIIFVDTPAHYGLRLHLGAEVRTISSSPLARAEVERINPKFDGDLVSMLKRDPTQATSLWVTPQDRWDDVRRQLGADGYVPISVGAAYRGFVVFRPVRAGVASGVILGQ